MPLAPDFSAIQITIASPEHIRSWSSGEVTKPETINYRTQRAEKNGLFDEKIFGPTRDYECFCGKYKGIRYKGIVCDRCGVELTRNVVRRERMGHIELATPVAHIWFLRSLPSRMAILLGLSSQDIEKVVYFAGYIVTEVHEAERKRVLRDLDAEFRSKVASAGESTDAKKKLKDLFESAEEEVKSLRPGLVLDEARYHRFSVRYSTLFEASIGAEAIYRIFKNMDLKAAIAEISEALKDASAAEREKLTKRLIVAESLFRAKERPEWMFITALPVLPAALRPMVMLEGGRHASSDLNDLYRRVINRNNRLKKLIEIKAPEVILRNEKRILQEAVDALVDNSIRHSATPGAAASAALRARPLKSLSDYLKGKQGYFRQNLLGKRVDYSGRSVIVVGPELALDECGLPKHMALELFRPFIIAKLIARELAYNIRGAGRLIEDTIPEVWAILEEVIKDKYVLLNRAPTLHRQGIQAFRPVLIEGDAIRVHPLVCTAFNADFDGDQMAVHVPLSREAQAEAREIMSANKNILKPGSGEPVIAMSQDIVLGCYWMTKIIEGAPGEGKAFSSPNEAICAYDYGIIGFRTKIRVLPTDSPKYEAFAGQLFETSVGRLLFNSVLPKDYPFINEELKKSSLVALVNKLIARYGLSEIPGIADKIKKFGFAYATRSGVTWSIDDIKVPVEKPEIIKEARARHQDIIAQYKDGLLSLDERRALAIENWHKAKSSLEALIPKTMDPLGSVYDLVISGARGSIGQIVQMAGMKGLIQNTKRETIEFPVIGSYKEGLSPIEYFITTHGSRSGLADVALNTARAGYLTRKLFDVAQDAIITEEECGTKECIDIGRISALGIEVDLAKNIRGRYLAKDVVGADGRKLFARGHFLTLEDAKTIEASDVPTVSVRSPMTCKSLHGVCRHCYGADVTTWEPIALGEAVGTVAAQAIGEPGTQLTMRMKHAGGAVLEGEDVVQGLPRVEEVFERRMPKNPAVLATVAGLVTDIKEDGAGKIVMITPEVGEKTKKNSEYPIYPPRSVIVSVGQKVQKGDFLSDGSADLTDLLKYAGREKTQEYIIHATSKIYQLQGVTISRKHMEVIIRQMFSRMRVKSAGSTQLMAGEVIEAWELADANLRAKKEGGESAVAETHLLGITEASLTRRSFLSASSFQNTTRILINAAIRGAEDKLRGLKENVIIGRLIPAGTGFPGSPKWALVQKIRDEEEEKRRLREAEAEALRAAEEDNGGVAL